MSLFDLSNVIEDLSTGPIEVELPAATTYVDGDAVQADPEVVKIDCAIVTPANEKQLQVLPEGDRTGDIVLVQTVKELPTSSVKDQTNASVVRYNDRRYRVMMQRDWAGAGNFHTALAKKIEEL